MDKGNVLVIGNSGVGKSTLINAVLGEDKAETGWGTKGTTEELEIFTSEQIPFRIIDTIGFEPTLIEEWKAIGAVKKWSKKSAKEGAEDTQINAIWFCVDGTARKLFPKAINSLARATAMWKSVPVIVVITKSYSEPERADNIEMVRGLFEKQKSFSGRLRDVIPVVASIFVINDDAYAAPAGITELIDATFELLPEGFKAAEEDVARFKLNRKRALSQGVVSASTAAASVIGAIPLPFADALILAPLETTMVNALSRIYGMDKNDNAKLFLKTIVEIGTVGLVAKTAISVLKVVPGVNIAASVLNAVVAGSIVAALGEGSIIAFEQVYLGKKSVDDIDWLRKFLESTMSSQYTEKVKAVIEEIAANPDRKPISELILDAFKGLFNSSDSIKVK